MPLPVLIPLLNPNEPEALLAALDVREGQKVARGEALCTLETTKSTAELEAEQDGFIVGLHFSQGQTVKAGELLCYLAEEADWTPPEGEQPVAARQPPAAAEPGMPISTAAPEGLRITQPALALARRMGLDFDRLPKDRLVTEDLVRAFQPEPVMAPTLSIARDNPDLDAIIVYGGGGHGKSLIDLLRALGTYQIVGIVDDGLSAGSSVLGVGVIGGSETLPDLFAQGVRLAVNAVGGIGNLPVRVEVFKKLAQAGFTCPAVIHPTAFVEPSAELSEGVQVMPHAYVGSQAKVGFGCIVNTGAILSHDCILGDYANISPGAVLAGEVAIGAGVLVGMGATVNLQVKVGAGARIGNGTTVKNDVPERGVVKAGSVWPE